MSKLIVDCVIETQNENFFFIPSRRQIDHDGGYVNNWNTKSFTEYVKSRNSNILICRDHAGPKQGRIDDDGLKSLNFDCKYFDIIHIDPFKNIQSFQDGIKYTLNLIEYCLSVNKNIKFEVGTEESIFKYDENDLNQMLDYLYKNLKSNFSQIIFSVIQSGTKLKANQQIGKYDVDKLNKMLMIVKKYDLQSKEHNGDYIDIDTIKNKFELGLNSINIAPELGMIQTEEILSNLNDNEIEKYWQLCYNSTFWHKWVDSKFDPIEQKIDLIKICGHYIFSKYEFQTQIYDENSMNNKIENKLKKKLNEYIAIM